MISGVGTDLVRIDRIAALIDDPAFRQRVYSVREQEQGEGRRGSARVNYYAGRWAAKEAAAKALGCGIGSKCGFSDVEILDDPESGAPALIFCGSGLTTAAQRRADQIFVSISHERDYAVATVILESR